MTWGGPHSARLAHQLDHLAQADAPSGSPLESSPPLTLTGRRPPRCGGAGVEQHRRALGLAEAELLAGEELAGGVGVLALDDVEVGRPGPASS